MTAYEILDPAFARLVAPLFPPELLWEGGLFTEGPACFPAGRYMLFTDIPNDRILRFDEITGTVAVFRQDCGQPNGQTVDDMGRLLTCEHRGRRVSRTEHDGRIVTLADRWQGKRLNSPNDVVASSDGAVWFTDPTYGILNDLDGETSAPEISGCHVYRLDPVTGALQAMITDMEMPNGLAFSRDESRLHVVDSGKSERPEGPAHIRTFEVEAGGRLSGGQVLAESTAGIFDGLRVDIEGHLWVAAGDGVHCLAPDGRLLGKILLGKVAANLAFGGPRGNILYVCACNALYRIRLKVRGR